MKIKVCGIKNAQDAAMVGRLGADEVGLLVGQVYHSNDFISPEIAKDIVGKCRGSNVEPVLVTHLRDPIEICNLACEVGTGIVQIHSPCSVADIRGLRARLEEFYPLHSISLRKGIHANSEPGVLFESVSNFQCEVDALVLDTIDSESGKVGGTGKTHDWNVSRKVVSKSKCPVFLAGGLGVDNVADAIAQVVPYGLDANSRLQNSKGFKDKQKVLDFVRKAKDASQKVHSDSLMVV